MPFALPVEAFRVTTLDSGARIATEAIPGVASISLGVWVRTGIAQETPSLAGITHFLEHMMFKGTERRTARQIAEEVDQVGGVMNAFTEREFTAFFVRLLGDHWPLGVDLLTDILRHPRLDAADVTRERQVVLEEINQYEDSPDELVHDLFTQTLWEGHPLGRSLLGTKETVAALDQPSVRGHFEEHYRPANMVVAAAGIVDHDALVAAFAPHLQGGGPIETENGAVLPKSGHRERFERRKTEQVHFCVGSSGYAYDDPKRYTLAVLDTALGGGMSSRLFQEIRENRGLVYSIGSFSASYRRGGFFVVSGGTSPSHWDQVRALIHEEITRARSQGLTAEELARVKEHIKGSLALAMESTSYRMRRLASSMIYYDRPISMQEIFDEVDGVTDAALREVAAEVLSDDALTIAAIGPVQ